MSVRLQPMPPYFFVAIPRKEQEEKKEKVGSIYLHFNNVYMTRNMQWGKIISIGEEAGNSFPEAKKDDILLFHHFIEKKERDFYVASDSNFNYYIVPCSRDEMNLVYGVWDGEKIITHPDYVMIEAPDEEFQNPNNLEKKGSLLVFKTWQMTREDKEAKMGRLKAEAQELAKSNPELPHVKKAIEEKEYEMKQISKDINSKRYEPYKLCWLNPQLNKHAPKEIEIGDTIYCLNIAAKTTIEFMNKKYAVCKTQHVCGFVK